MLQQISVNRTALWRRSLLTLLLTGTLAGCDQGTESQAQAANTAQTPQKGGNLLIAIDTDPNCIDPQQAGNNNSLNIGRQLTDSLTDQDPESGRIVPWLAESWQIEDNNQRFTFHLRDGVTFSDGSPFTAQSVKDNFAAIVKLGAKASLASTYLKGLQSVETPDAHTVVISFNQPNAQFLQATSTMSLGFFAADTVNASAEARCQGKLTGSGPFVLKQFIHNQKVELTRRSGYQWPSSLASHQGGSYLDGVEYRVIPESGVRFGSIISGQLDVNVGVTPQDEQLLLDKNITLNARPNPGLVYSLFPNRAGALMADDVVRKALNLAIDRPALKPVLSRYQHEATSVLAKTTPLYQDLSPQLKYDPQTAEKLLDEHGWRKGADGIRSKNGERLSFRISYWQNAPFLEVVQQQLKQVGIDLQLEKAPISQVVARQASGKIDVDFYNLTRSDPDVLRTVFDANGRNVNKRQPGEVDKLLVQSSETLDSAQRQQSVTQAAQLLIEEGNAIPLVELATVIATGPQVHGFHFDASSRFQLYDTWLTKKE